MYIYACLIDVRKLVVMYVCLCVCVCVMYFQCCLCSDVCILCTVKQTNKAIMYICMHSDTCSLLFQASHDCELMKVLSNVLKMQCTCVTACTSILHVSFLYESAV